MAEAVVRFVVARVGDLLIQEAIFLDGVPEQVEQMQTKLKRMQRFLKDADKRQDEEESVKGWISDIREVAYDAEDVIKTFALEVASRSKPGFRNKFTTRYATIFLNGAKLHKVGNDIEAIKTRITDLTESLYTYGIRFREEGEASSSSVFKRQRELRQTYSHLVEEYTVGLERDTEILVRELVTGEKQYQVVSICGMGGLGKTTLANKVYHHKEVRRHFDGFAWAFISQQFKTRDIWEEILLKLSPKEQREEIRKMRDDEIAEELHQIQQEKKCLVILDDIWSVEAWHVLKPAFPRAAGSKIVLTSRNKTIALHVSPRRILELQCLTEEESWELLKKKAFMIKKDFPDFKSKKDLEELGRKMAGKCAGLPLAINVLGGILATKNSYDEWTKVHENIVFYLSGEGHEQKLYGVQRIIGLSYHELPYQLKPCFLYFAHFPKDYEIQTKELLRLWVAEGFVSQQSYEVEENQIMEDIAELYLHELINRCMVQTGVVKSSGAVKTCRVHDLMRDSCLLIANEEKFLEIVHGQKGNKQVVSNRVRRLAMHGVGDPMYYSRAPKLRSLLFFMNGENEISTLRSCKFLSDSCKLLSILTFDALYNTDDKTWTEEIGKLVHLRYLSIKSCWIETLPSSIGNLRYLETLIVNTKYLLLRVPNVIWKLERLRHLNLGLFWDITFGGDLQLGLRYLQTLKTFDGSVLDVRELVNITNLRNLCVTFYDMEELKVIQPPGLRFNRLTSLYIKVIFQFKEPYLEMLLSSSCPNLYKLRLRGEIPKLPEHHQFPPNLTKLTLVRSWFKKDPMTTLEKLPKLEFLCLKDNALWCKEIVCSSKGFPQLKTLILEEKANYLAFWEWRVDEEAMPNLSQLCITRCLSLKMLPDGLRFIATLRELVIKSMLPEFIKRLQVVNEEGEGGEDLYKVQHVPSVVFLD